METSKTSKVIMKTVSDEKLHTSRNVMRNRWNKSLLYFQNAHLSIWTKLLAISIDLAARDIFVATPLYHA